MATQAQPFECHGQLLAGRPRDRRQSAINPPYNATPPADLTLELQVHAAVVVDAFGRDFTAGRARVVGQPPRQQALVAHSFNEQVPVPAALRGRDAGRVRGVVLKQDEHARLTGLGAGPGLDYADGVHPGSVKTLYRLRRVGLILACVTPVLALAGLWLLVTQVLLVPSTPNESTPPDALARYIMHEKGLPRLKGPRCEAFLQQQIRRLVQDEPFRQRFLAEYRTASPDEQKAFRTHLFDAFKPLVMRDIRGYQQTAEPARQAYLDERIVAYNRMNAFVGDVRLGKSDLGPAAPGSDEMLQLLMQKTSEEERQAGVAYGVAVAARVQQILADPELKAAMEARIAAKEP